MAKYRHSYRTNASKLHQQVGDILRTEYYFSNFQCLQEYPVSKVNLDYHTNRECFDWVILELKVVIEVMGIQHEKATSWSGDIEDAIDNLRGIRRRDFTKRDAALSAGWSYLAIPYTYVNKLTGDILLNMITSAMELGSNPTTIQEDKLLEDMKASRDRQKKQRLELENMIEQQANNRKISRRKFLQSDAHKEQLKSAREYCHQQYLKIKENQ